MRRHNTDRYWSAPFYFGLSKRGVQRLTGTLTAIGAVAAGTVYIASYTPKEGSKKII